MSGLAEFLMARIRDDEEAVAEYERKWSPARKSPGWSELLVDDEYASVIIDPSRVLAECEAKRRIVERCLEARADADYQPSSGSAELADDTLSLLALPYADHPDYDEAWRP